MSETKATRAAYGEALVKLGHENDKIVVLDADLSNATMTMNFAKEFPNRHFDVGIAEANMVDMAAGMSTMGLIPLIWWFVSVKLKPAFWGSRELWILTAPK